MKLISKLLTALLLGISVTASGQTLKIIDPAEANYYSFNATGISPDGQFITGECMGSSASYYSYAFITSLQKWTEKKAIYGNAYYHNQSFIDVNNQGYACGYIGDDDNNIGVGSAVPWSTGSEDRHWAKGLVYYSLPPQSPIDAVGVYDINDNNTILGTLWYMYTSNNYYVEPVLWTCSDEQVVNMVNLPLPTEMIENLSWYQVIPLAISEDETIIIGYVCAADYGGRYIPLKWSVENGQYVCTALSDKNIEPMFYSDDHEYTTPYISFEPSSVSENCEWIGGDLYDTERNLFTARYNVATDKFEVLPSSNSVSSFITNDGTMIWNYTYSTDEGTFNSAYYWSPNSTTATDIKEVFPILSDIGSFFVHGISSDAKTIVGTQYGGSEGGNKIFVLTEATPSGISCINTDKGANCDAIYNLNGIRVNKTTAKGLYIKNGKKVVVR